MPGPVYPPAGLRVCRLWGPSAVIRYMARGAGRRGPRSLLSSPSPRQERTTAGPIRRTRAQPRRSINAPICCGRRSPVVSRGFGMMRWRFSVPVSTPDWGRVGGYGVLVGGQMGG